MDDQEELDDEDANMNYRESHHMNDQDDDAGENAQDRLAAAGLEDSDAEDEMVTFYIYFFVIDFQFFI